MAVGDDAQRSIDDDAAWMDISEPAYWFGLV
jgi:hypothetical protein